MSGPSFLNRGGGKQQFHAGTDRRTGTRLMPWLRGSGTFVHNVPLPNYQQKTNQRQHLVSSGGNGTRKQEDRNLKALDGKILGVDVDFVD